MSTELEQIFEQIIEEKGISRDELMNMIEASLAAAFKRDYGRRDQLVRVEFNPATMGVKVFDIKHVVEVIEEPGHQIDLETAHLTHPDAQIGDELSTEVTPTEGAKFGRIAAQTAKQVIVQKLREAERNMQFSEFKAKERTLVSGLIQRIEGDSVIVDLGKGVGVLFPSEQIRGEKLEIGQRVKVLVLHVEPATRGPKITLSRSHPDLVRKLFEQEVPEILNGTVEIRAIAREAGSRTKIAVYADQEGIDPIGACVGQKGMRVQAVITELGGEKIDIITFDEDMVKFIANALSPAKILHVQLNYEAKEAKVGVIEEQLSLAIGKAGQNVRLAARLTGWKIDISGEKLGNDIPAEIATEESVTEDTATAESAE